MQLTTLVMLQSIVHVFCDVLHDVQPVGQPLFASPIMRGASFIMPGASIVPGTTQNPLSQTVPECAAQSAVFVHEYSWLLWLTEQAASATRMTSAFIANLQS